MSKLGSALVKDKVITVEFPDCPGFNVKLGFLAREELANVRNQSLKYQFNRVTKQKEEVVDNDKFLEAYTEKAIKGWSGLKWKYLKGMLALDMSGKDPEAELEYSPEEAIDLMKYSVIFDQWVTEQMQDFEQFSNTKRETQTKN